MQTAALARFPLPSPPAQVQAVDGDDYGLLVSSCETYNRIVTTAAKRAALAQGLPADFDVRRPPKRPSFLTSGGRPLTTVAALANAQPRLLLYLISQGAEIDATGFKWVLIHPRAHGWGAAACFVYPCPASY